MRHSIFLLILFFLGLSPETNAGIQVRRWISPQGEKVLSVQEKGNISPASQVVLRSLPRDLFEGELPPSVERYEEVVYPTTQLPFQYFQHLMSANIEKALQYSLPHFEMRTLIQQGSPKNRIDLPILAEGYTLEEKEKFFKDAQRITDDLFQGKTFSSYLPLFNVYAIFVASPESGISGVKKVRSAFGLRRVPANSKRGIIPGNRAKIDEAFSRAPDSDYPIILVNDDYYGGLGGQYAITTRSLTSGSMVLRHELGHNFGNVGEEYDGGRVYQGANHSRSPAPRWKAWMKDLSEVHTYQQLSGAYVWENLKGNAQKIRFRFPRMSGGQERLEIKLSTVGWESPDDVHVLLNGRRLDLQGVFTQDRSFFLVQTSQISPGDHVLEIKENISDGNNVLAFARIYALPSHYNEQKDVVGAFATYRAGRKLAGYRPTHDSCLMRNMRAKNFCAVDQENMWKRFLKRTSLIDGLKIRRKRKASQIRLETPLLKGLEIRWFEQLTSGKETERVAWRNLKEVETSDRGKFRVEVRFESDEIKSRFPEQVVSRFFQLK